MTDDGSTLKTPIEWDEDPRNGISILSWSDFGRNARRDGVTWETRITWRAFRTYRRDVTVHLKSGRTWWDADGVSNDR